MQRHTCPFGKLHSIPGKLCLLFSAMLDRLTRFCCYVTAGSLPSGEPLEQNNQRLKHCSTLSNTWLRPSSPHTAPLHCAAVWKKNPLGGREIRRCNWTLFSGFHYLHLPQILSFYLVSDLPHVLKYPKILHRWPEKTIFNPLFATLFRNNSFFIIFVCESGKEWGQ